MRWSQESHGVAQSVINAHLGARGRIDLGLGGSSWSLGGSPGTLEAHPGAVNAYSGDLETHTKVLEVYSGESGLNLNLWSLTLRRVYSPGDLEAHP
jgi:hypothetical protein